MVWTEPFQNQMQEEHKSKVVPPVYELIPVTFDIDKMRNCKVESERTLAHSICGKGFGLINFAMSQGCYEWKV